MNTSYRLLVTGTLPVGAVAAAVLGQAVGPQAALLLFALLLPASVLSVIFSPLARLRTLPRAAAAEYQMGRRYRQMSRSLLEDAFAHHVWATMRLIDACGTLSAEQLVTAVPGTYGSILNTARHLVGGDAWYIFYINGDRTFLIDKDEMDLPALRSAMEGHAAAWSKLLSQDLDPDAVLREIDEDDGYVRDAPVGIRFAQALHHGSDHRSQICTALTAFGARPPAIDVWDYGLAAGRVTEIQPTS